MNNKKTAKTNKFKKFFINVGKHINKWSPYTKNKLINCLIYILDLFIILGINYCVIFGAFVPKFFILDLLLMIFSISPIFFFKGTMFDRIWIPIIMLLVVVFITINVNYYKFFKVIFSLKDLQMAFDNMGQVGTNAKNLNWLMIGVNIGLYFLFTSCLLVFNIRFRFNETKNNKNPKRINISIFAGALMFCSLVTYEFSLGMWTISERSKDIGTIDRVKYNSNYHFKNMGMMSYYNKELRQLTSNTMETDEETIEYLSNPTYVDDNYTGVLSNPNVFVIMLETGDQLIVNEGTTPNLYNLYKKAGVLGEHNYSFNHTRITNPIEVLGSYPLDVLNNKNYEYSVPFDLPNLLKGNNYNTRLYYESIPSQDSDNDLKFIPSLGFDNVFDHNAIIPGVDPWHYADFDFIRDSITADGIIKNLKEFHSSSNDKFYCHWMTIHMHMDTVETKKNKQMIQDLRNEFGPRLEECKQKGLWKNPCTTQDASQRYELFTLKSMDFDKALGKLFDFFYKSDDPELENTLLITCADHIWWESADGKYMAKWAKGIDDNNNIKLYSTVFGLYHPLLTDMIENDKSGLFINHGLQKMTTPACLVPTVLDLCGIPYNKKLYQDHSIFDLNNEEKYDSKYDEVYYSAWLNKFMDEHFTASFDGIIESRYDDKESESDFLKKVNDKTKQFQILDKIYHGDFFKSHNYNDFVPLKLTFSNNITNDQAIVKHY